MDATKNGAPSLLRAETQEELFDRTGVTKLCSEEENFSTAWRHLLSLPLEAVEDCSPQQQLLVKVLDARRQYKYLTEENKKLTARVWLEQEGVSAFLRRAQEHIANSHHLQPSKDSSPAQDSAAHDPLLNATPEIPEEPEAVSHGQLKSANLLKWLVPDISGVQSFIGRPVNTPE